MISLTPVRLKKVPVRDNMTLNSHSNAPLKHRKLMKNVVGTSKNQELRWRIMMWRFCKMIVALKIFKGSSKSSPIKCSRLTDHCKMVIISALLVQKTLFKVPRFPRKWITIKKILDMKNLMSKRTVKTRIAPNSSYQTPWLAISQPKSYSRRMK